MIQFQKAVKIYILLSIKTRIETARWEGRSSDKTKFISYYPLKQGLKPPILTIRTSCIFHLYPTIH